MAYPPDEDVYSQAEIAKRSAALSKDVQDITSRYASEPYIIKAGEFDPETMERQVTGISADHWRDDPFEKEWASSFVNPEKPIIVRDKPRPPQLEDNLLKAVHAGYDAMGWPYKLTETKFIDAMAASLRGYYPELGGK